MRLALRTTLAATAALAATCAATMTVAPASGGQADRQHRAAAEHSASTAFALRGWGYGTRVEGGDVPTSSAPTALQSIGCTNRAGLVRSNHVADVRLPSLGRISGVRTQVWTTRASGVVSSWARNTIGKVVLSDSSLGTLYLDAVSTTARAYHDGKRFRTATHTDLATLRFRGPAGPPLAFPIPTPGRPVEIPGFATVTIAHSLTHRSVTGASAFANGLKVELHATHTVVRVAHAVALINSGIRSGLFGGRSYAVSARAVADIVDLGQNPLLKMSCTGTNGKLRARSLASIDLGGQVVIHAATSEQRARQTSRRAWGFERSRVASIDLGKGRLRIDGIIGQVNVARHGAHLRTLDRSIRGTAVGRVYVGGRLQALPSTGVLEIPGLARIESKVTRRIADGLAVTALRITLLDGTGAVINLGNARFQVHRAAR